MDRRLEDQLSSTRGVCSASMIVGGRVCSIGTKGIATGSKDATFGAPGVLLLGAIGCYSGPHSRQTPRRQGRHRRGRTPKERRGAAGGCGGASGPRFAPGRHFPKETCKTHHGFKTKNLINITVFCAQFCCSVAPCLAPKFIIPRAPVLGKRSEAIRCPEARHGFSTQSMSSCPFLVGIPQLSWFNY